MELGILRISCETGRNRYLLPDLCETADELPLRLADFLAGGDLEA